MRGCYRVFLDAIVGLLVAGIVIGTNRTWLAGDEIGSRGKRMLQELVADRSALEDRVLSPEQDAGSEVGVVSPEEQDGAEQLQAGWQGPAPRCPAQWDSLYFAHVPKTAGSFLKTLLKAGLRDYGTGSGHNGSWCPLERLTEVYNGCVVKLQKERHPVYDQSTMFPRVLSALFPEWCNGLAAHADVGISGAVLGGEEGQAWHSSLRLTMLREPVARLISSYHFRRKYCARSVKVVDCDYNFGNETEELLEHARRNGNSMTLQVGGWSDCAWKTPSGRLSHTLGCMQTNADGCGKPEAERRRLTGEQLLATAKANLERFCWVGLQERMEESLELLKRVTGWFGLNVSALNAVNANEHPPPPEHVAKKVEELTQLDVDLYKYAVEMFEKRLREAGIEGQGRAGGAGAIVAQQQVQGQQAQAEEGADGAGDLGNDASGEEAPVAGSSNSEGQGAAGKEGRAAIATEPAATAVATAAVE